MCAKWRILRKNSAGHVISDRDQSPVPCMGSMQGGSPWIRITILVVPQDSGIAGPS